MGNVSVLLLTFPNLVFTMHYGFREEMASNSGFL